LRAPLKANSNELDIENIFNAQFPSSYAIETSPPVLSSKKPRCFQVPFSQKNVDHTGDRTSIRANYPFKSKLTNEKVSKVETFISKANGSSGQTIKPSFVGKRIATSTVKIKSLPKKKTTPLTVIPETPKPKKFVSSPVFESDDLNIIEDSDEEYKGEVYKPCLQTPGKLTIPPAYVPGGHVRDGVQLRSVEEIRILFLSLSYTVFDKNR